VLPKDLGTLRCPELVLSLIRWVSLSQLCAVGLDCVCGGWVLADRAMHAGLLWCSCGGCVPGAYSPCTGWTHGGVCRLCVAYAAVRLGVSGVITGRNIRACLLCRGRGEPLTGSWAWVISCGDRSCCGVGMVRGRSGQWTTCGRGTNNHTQRVAVIAIYGVRVLRHSPSQLVRAS